MKEIDELKNIGKELSSLNNTLKQSWNKLSSLLPMLNSKSCYIEENMQAHGLEKLSKEDAKNVSSIIEDIKDTQNKLNEKGQIFFKKQAEVLSTLNKEASKYEILKNYVPIVKNNFNKAINYSYGIDVLETFSELIEYCQKHI